MSMIQKIEKRIYDLKETRKTIADLLRRGNAPLKPEEQAVKSGFSLRGDCISLKQLRIAGVMDRFTLDSYTPECNLLELTPDGWREQIDAFQPDLLFIESAWEGKDGLWHRKIANGSKEYFELTSYCQEKEIPIVFWNKEDPVYTDTFMTAARMADFIFTTDIDCIEKYKSNLGHDRVYHLHFAAQPRLHNPIEKFDRKDKFCFAGAYYHRYPQRARVFDAFSEVFLQTKGLDIYDRNYQNARPEHAFPAVYNPYILGKLDPSEIDVAYKGYTYGINMNSVQQSQTMFARRVFEMLASNTVTVGNYSRGLKNYFGDLTVCTDDAGTLNQYLSKYCADPVTLRKYRLAGLRKVLSHHLYEDRLAYIAGKVFGKDLRPRLPQVTVAARTKTESEAGRLISAFQRQTHLQSCLYLICDGFAFSAPADERIKVLSNEQANAFFPWKEADNGYAALWEPQNYYGTNYLYDLVLTTRYASYHGIGKQTHFCKRENSFSLENEGNAYRTASSLPAAASIIHASVLRTFSLSQFADQTEFHGEGLFSADEFNFCAGCTAEVCPQVDDLIIPDEGIELSRIEKIAESIQAPPIDLSALTIDAAMLAGCKIPQGVPVRLIQQNAKTVLESCLAEGVHSYFYLEQLFETAPLLHEGKLLVLFQGTGSLDLICVCLCYSREKKKLTPLYPKLNRNETLSLPEGTAYIKIGFRPKGPGSMSLHQVRLGGGHPLQPHACFLSRSNVLVLTNQYPSPEALYRNMFVHKRMTSYREEGHVFDVMRMNIYAKDGYHEFEGINVVEGQSAMLASILDSGCIDTVCVHFLDAQMWSVLEHYAKNIRIIVWLHGSEIQPWWRREYNYHSDSELEKAKAESQVRQDFWKQFFKSVYSYQVHFVFVSQYFADEIFEDNHITLKPEIYSIIHNCIDTELFQYIEKPIEQRKNLLSIRPFASDKYANDLTVQCLLELSKEPFFKELDVLIIGNGQMFEDILKPLKRFKNVKTRKTFLRQDEIASFHRQYGIFLTPTRMDAQGVSRDEAMSSGLIPVTNAVTAIPEFVDNTCGILAPGEDYMAMAEGIKRLYHDPDLFLTMSKNAADRVRRQSGKEQTIMKELELITGNSD